MRRINASLFVLIIFGTLSLFAKQEREQTVQFGNMKATYFGNGTLEAIPVMGTDVWDLRVTDAGVFYLDGTLTVAPQGKYAKTPQNVSSRNATSTAAVNFKDDIFFIKTGSIFFA